MKNTRRMIESGALAVVLAIAGAASVVSAGAANTGKTNTQVQSEAAETTQDTLDIDTASIVLTSPSSYLTGYEDRTGTSASQQLTVTTNISLSSQTAEDTDDTEQEVVDYGQITDWENILMADVENKLNVREEASEDAEIVGKLYKGAAATVLEVGEEWTKISSGDVEGYVKNEYCVYGEDAEALADEICETYATVTADTLRIREEASTDSKTLKLLSNGSTVTVDTDAEEQEGWIAITYEGETAYISADYAEVSQDIDTAMTIEEEKEMIAAQKAAEEAAAAAASKSSGSSSSSSSSSGSSSKSATTTVDSGVSANVDDVTLLAALIYCEAGGESYEGQLAVGAVVVNRVQSSSYPNSVSGVIYQKGQFSPASNGNLAKAISSGAGNKCLKAAQEALSGVDNTGGALSFRPGKGSGTVIGNQTFY